MEIVSFAGGEPTLAPIQFLAKLARRLNNYLNFITNGFLFDESYYRSIADVRRACTSRSPRTAKRSTSAFVRPHVRGAPAQHRRRRDRRAGPVWDRGDGLQSRAARHHVRFVHDLGVRRS